MNVAGRAAVVVAVHNEAQVLASVLEDLLAVFPHVVVVDDGSSDDSAAIAHAAGAVVLRHAVNLGQGAALQTGFDYVVGRTPFDYVVTFDGDGQHDPADAHAMLQFADERALEAVLGTRHGGGTTGQTRSRRLLLRAGVIFTRLSTGLSVTDTHNGLRVLSRSALARLRLTQNGMAYASELEAAIASQGLRWAEVAVTIAYTDYSRGKGQRNVNAINVVYDLVSARLRTPR